MTSEVALFLRQGWVNLWKNRSLWVFSFLVLVDPLIRFIAPIPKYDDLASALFSLALSLTFAYLSVMSSIGVLVVAYCIAIGKFIDIQTAFQYAINIFWRVVGLLLILVIIVSPCFFASFVISYREPFNIAKLAHNFFFLLTPLSVFMAMQFFPITEIIANNSKISKSLRTAWAMFTSNFLTLAIIGLGLALASYITNIFISTTTVLAQNSFDFAVVSKVDFISPHLSVDNNNFYNLISTTARAEWRTYSVSIFTLAYLEYSGAKMNKDSAS